MVERGQVGASVYRRRVREEEREQQFREEGGQGIDNAKKRRSMDEERGEMDKTRETFHTPKGKTTSGSNEKERERGKEKERANSISVLDL